MAVKKARVLRTTQIGEKIYQPNDIVSDDEKTLKPYEQDGSIDGGAEAVSYCEKAFAEQHKASARKDRAQPDKA